MTFLFWRKNPDTPLVACVDCKHFDRPFGDWGMPRCKKYVQAEGYQYRNHVTGQMHHMLPSYGACAHKNTDGHCRDFEGKA